MTLQGLAPLDIGPLWCLLGHYTGPLHHNEGKEPSLMANCTRLWSRLPLQYNLSQNLPSLCLLPGLCCRFPQTRMIFLQRRNNPIPLICRTMGTLLISEVYTIPIGPQLWSETTPSTSYTQIKLTSPGVWMPYSSDLCMFHLGNFWQHTRAKQATYPSQGQG